MLPFISWMPFYVKWKIFTHQIMKNGIAALKKNHI
jgi:hypothetical protein